VVGVKEIEEPMRRIFETFSKTLARKVRVGKTI
jgi:hypothetical protein